MLILFSMAVTYLAFLLMVLVMYGTPLILGLLGLL